MNRETWLQLITLELAPLFADLKKPLPEKLRMSCGFPSSKKAIGECWYPVGSADGTTEVFIHPGQSDGMDVGAILIHELCHAALGQGFGHGKEFASLAQSMGLEGPARATHAGAKAKEILKAAIEKVGPFPHAALNGGVAADKPKKQKSKAHTNLNCPACGFHAKVLKEQMTMGRLVCPADGEMLLTKEEAADWEGGDEG